MALGTPGSSFGDRHGLKSQSLSTDQWFLISISSTSTQYQHQPYRKYWHLIQPFILDDVRRMTKKNPEQENLSTQEIQRAKEE